MTLSAPAASEAGLDLSIVVIGLNEIERLPDALQSARRALQRIGRSGEILYVDSGSTDGSCEFASIWPDVKVLRLPRAQANAARARNLGIAAARGRLVQLLDGDMTVDPDWLVVAMPAMVAGEVAAVAGQLEEVSVADSLWNATFGHDWGAAVGPAEALGGAALWRRAALVELGGFDAALRVGEDTDLSLRARAAGHALQRLPARMAGHHLGLQGARDWWRRGVSVGSSHAGVADRHGRARRLAGAGIWGELAVLGASGGVAAAATACSDLAWWGALLLAWALLQALRGLRLLWRDRRAGLPFDQALVHSAHVLAVKLPIAWGRMLHQRAALQPAGGGR